MKKQHYLILSLVVLSFTLISACLKKPAEEKADKHPAASKKSYSVHNSKIDYFPSIKNGKLVRHKYYDLSYVEKHEQPEWVAYELTKAEVMGKVKRKDDFREDPKVVSGSATLGDYKRSGYDRGHLAPAADMKFSKQAMSESFYMSNMSPQNPSFNRGIWKELEEKVRDWAVKNERIYVVTGGVLTDGLPTIGEEKVSIPKYYYKVLLDYASPEVKAIAFVLPNKNSKKPLSNFAVSIDSVEELTGIDFFPSLPDDQEKALESKFDYELWEKRN